MDQKKLIAALRRRQDLVSRAGRLLNSPHPYLDEHATALQDEVGGVIYPAQGRVRLGSLLSLNTSQPAVEKVMDSVVGAVGAEGSTEWFRLLAVLAWLNAELRFLVDDDPVPEVAPKGYYGSLRLLSVRIRFVAFMSRVAATSERDVASRRGALLAAIGIVLVSCDDHLRRESKLMLEPLLSRSEFDELAMLGADALDGLNVGDTARALRDALRSVREQQASATDRPRISSAAAIDLEGVAIQSVVTPAEATGPRRPPSVATRRKNDGVRRVLDAFESAPDHMLLEMDMSRLYGSAKVRPSKIAQYLRIAAPEFAFIPPRDVSNIGIGENIEDDDRIWARAPKDESGS